MIIKKFYGKTKEEAIEKARQELGDQVVIMNIKDVRPAGMLGVFKKSTFEVTGAIEDGVLKRPSYNETPAPSPTPAPSSETAPKKVSNTASRSASVGKFSAVADESIRIPLTEKPETPENFTSDTLRDVFKEVNEVIRQGAPSQPEQRTFDPNTNIIPRENVRDLGNTMTLNNNVREPAPIRTAGVYERPAGTPLSHTQPLPKIEVADSTRTPARETESPKKPAAATEAVSRTKENGTKDTGEQEFTSSSKTLDVNFVKMMYQILLKNEIDERYINQLIEDMGRVISSGNSLDYMISNVYQKMVLTMGKPQVIELKGKKPKVVFLIGPTGVGKTTTIAKLAAKHKVNLDKRVALITSDEYRIAAVEQLRKYASIMNMPMLDVSTSQNLSIGEAIERFMDYDVVFVDTTGFSHRNEEQRNHVANLIHSVDPQIEKEVFLVLSVTTKYKDLKEIIDTYKSFTDFNLIFTKLDESPAHGNILNCKLYSGAELSYVTTGQAVPEDIEVVDTQKMVKQFLGGK